MTDETNLVLLGIGVPPYSARGLSQTLEPIPEAGQVRRTVNGDLVDCSVSQFRKYRSTITCGDQQAPAIDGIWPGVQVTVHCVAELAYPVSGAAQRPIVSGSDREETGFICYRPILEMMVTNLSEQRDEYGHITSWQMTLEEI